jgi:hypothetical protein
MEKEMADQPAKQCSQEIKFHPRSETPVQTDVKYGEEEHPNHHARDQIHKVVDD